jgi:hypothetical protein
VCSVDGTINGDSKDVERNGVRCTSASLGRLSRWRFRVREEKREGVAIADWGVV